MQVWCTINLISPIQNSFLVAHNFNFDLSRCNVIICPPAKQEVWCWKHIIYKYGCSCWYFAIDVGYKVQTINTNFENKTYTVTIAPASRVLSVSWQITVSVVLAAVVWLADLCSKCSVPSIILSIVVLAQPEGTHIPMCNPADMLWIKSTDVRVNWKQKKHKNCHIRENRQKIHRSQAAPCILLFSIFWSSTW